MTAFARYAAKMLPGGYSPIPQHPTSGKPLVKWLDLRTTAMTRDKIELFARNQPEASLAVICGHKGLISPDIDVDDPDIIAAVWKALPQPSVTRRGRRGYAAFYYDPTGAIGERNFAPPGGKPIVEIKAKTPITIPPSIHRKTGQPYVWLTEATLFNTQVEDLVEITSEDIVRLEEALAPWCPIKSVYVPPPLTSFESVNDKRMQRYAEAALARAVGTLATMRGGRREGVRDKARSLGKFVHGRFLSEAQVEAELLAVCRVNGALAKHKLPRLRETIRDGLAYAKSDPLPVLPDRPVPYRYGSPVKAGRRPLRAVMQETRSQPSWR